MLDIISKQIVYPLYWKSRGFDIANQLKSYEKSQWLSPDELKDRQLKALSMLLYHAYEHVRYYTNRFKTAGINPGDIKTLEDFAAVPFLAKDDINSNRDELIADNTLKSSLVADSTGGSTGKKVFFLEDKNELSHRFAAALRSDSWAGLKSGDRFVQIWGSPLDFNKKRILRRFFDRLLLRRMFVSSFYLSDDDLESVVKGIRRFKPKVIIGYPTPLHRLAKYVSEKGYENLGIKSIISSSETLYDFQKQKIEAAFNSMVFNRYGCREFGPVATECEEGNLHILSDRLIVEIDTTSCNYPDGAGELVITDLHKYGMPFIRYKIGDAGVLSDKTCSCGRGLPIMKSVEGRTFDLIIGTNGNFVAGTFWTLLFRSVPGIDMFKVHQKGPDKIDILIEPGTGFVKESLSQLEKTIQDKCGAEMKIKFDVVSRIPNTESGKHRFIVSDVAKEYFKK